MKTELNVRTIKVNSKH